MIISECESAARYYKLASLHITNVIVSVEGSHRISWDMRVSSDNIMRSKLCHWGYSDDSVE